MALQLKIGYSVTDKDGKVTEIPFQTHRNYVKKPFHGEVNNDPSMTIPDQSLTVKELMEKHASGNLPAIAKSVSYDENPTFDSIDPTLDPAFDLTDATELKSQIEEKISNADRAKAKKAAEAKQKTVQAEIDAKVAEQIAAKKKPEEES